MFRQGKETRNTGSRHSLWHVKQLLQLGFALKSLPRPRKSVTLPPSSGASSLAARDGTAQKRPRLICDAVLPRDSFFYSSARYCCATEREKELGRHEALVYGALLLCAQGSAAPSIQSFHALRYLVIVPLLAVFFVVSTSHAALTFDLRAVSGSQVTIHNPKSVAVTQNSVGGWIDFELWALVSGNNTIATDDGMQNFIGNMLSTHVGRGAVVGNMINTGEVAPHLRRGVLTPFDGPAYQDGTVQNLDGDFELEIGGTDYAIGEVTGMIAARTGPDNTAYYEGDGQLASLPLYRFTLPIESVPAESLADMTRVHFYTSGILAGFIWFEDSVPYSPRFEGAKRPGTMLVNEPVLIHTAQTPEELAAIPEPGTWLLGLLAIVGLALARMRRPTNLLAMNRARAIVLLLVACSAFLSSQAANAALTFDIRAREVTGPGVTKINEKSVEVFGVGGKAIFDVWAAIQGADANLTNDRLLLYSFRIKSNGVGSIGNMFADHTVNPDTGPVNGWEINAGASSGTLQDLDGDGDIDIGAMDTVFAGSTAGNANGFGGAPAYTGSGPVAQFHVYSFELPITHLRPGDLTVQMETSPVPVAFLWREDVATGFNKNGNLGTVAVGSGVAVNVVPEPGTWELAAVAFVGLAVALRRAWRILMQMNRTVFIALAFVSILSLSATSRRPRVRPPRGLWLTGHDPQPQIRRRKPEQRRRLG